MISRGSESIGLLINENETRVVAEYERFYDHSDEFCILSLDELHKGYMDERKSIIKDNACHYFDKMKNSPINKALR